ncbi:hypothetical protein PIB30_077169 [Stylosanthes scabra]|uniref:Uncharacterized protein n=1 Tax=Stylosanthes scabra TaxID=79078 RepID=A0ABU6XQW1_9FABA|nr:hypothetical protein [Stylosanthes scabra]
MQQQPQLGSSGDRLHGSADSPATVVVSSTNSDSFSISGDGEDMVRRGSNSELQWWLPWTTAKTNPKAMVMMASKMVAVIGICTRRQRRGSFLLPRALPSVFSLCSDLSLSVLVLSLPFFGDGGDDTTFPPPAPSFSFSLSVFFLSVSG